MAPHYEESLERDIGRIKRKVSEMATLAAQALSDSLQAFRSLNRQLAYSVVLRDERIDDLEKEIDRLCLEFIVRQQPVGGHLRFAFATIKVNSELERVGDYAESIARQTLAVADLGLEIPEQPFEEMARLAIPMFAAATRAFVAGDPDAAWKATDQEDRVDLLRHSFGSELIAWRERDQIPLAAFGPLLNVVNRLERVADQARSISQETVYVATGHYAKHQGSEVYRVLFVDDHNACRSAMAEAIACALGEPRFVFSSAGVDPREAVDGAAAFFLESKGLKISRHRPRSIDQVPLLDHYQVIVALSEDAHRVFPPPPSKTVCLEWVLPDPCRVHGRAEDVEAALESAYQFLKTHVQDLTEAILGNAAAPASD